MLTSFTAQQILNALYGQIARSGEIKWAAIDIASNGDNTVVTGVAGKRIRVISIMFLCTSAVTVAWKSGASTTRIPGQAWPANGGVALEIAIPYFVETDAGDNLVANLSGALQVSGFLGYVEV